LFAFLSRTELCELSGQGHFPFQFVQLFSLAIMPLGRFAMTLADQPAIGNCAEVSLTSGYTGEKRQRCDTYSYSLA